MKSGDREQGRLVLQRALDECRDLSDAWLWLAATTADPAEQKQHLDWAIAANPGNTAARRWLALDVWQLRGHRPAGLSPERPWSVDIFIPCSREPLEVIRTTLQAIKSIAYETLEVYVLDDGGSRQVARLAESLGFHYLSRPDAGLALQDSKSGNLNFGLQHSRGDLILVLDADQVPVPEILQRLVGFFRLPRVAYVQSQQSFFLPEGDPFYNGDRVFYETIQMSNDQADAVVSCGSGVVYRRQALEEMGGFATWNLVEDFTTSYELLSRGWRSLYFPYPLSRGLAPATLAGVYHQRFQWCLDTMRLFFWDNPLWKRGLNWPQKRHFLIVMLSYLVSGLTFPVFYAIPLLVYLVGLFIHFPAQYGFPISTVLSGVALFSLGASKVLVTQRNAFRSGLEMLLVGGLAAGVAYIVGSLLRGIGG